MVRRVGFGDEDPEDGRSVADRVLDGFRKRAANDKARRAAAQANSDAAKKARRSRIGRIVWLFAWSVALVVAVVSLNLSGGSLGVWSGALIWIAIAIWIGGRVVMKMFRS